MDIETTPRVEDTGDYVRIWIDVTVNGEPLQNILYAGATHLKVEDAEAFVAGEFGLEELKRKMGRYHRIGGSKGYLTKPAYPLPQK